MSKALLTISSKNYSSWSLRGWLICRMAGLDFGEKVLPSDDPNTRAELLLLSPSFLVPCLTDDSVKVWDTLAIAEYLYECHPESGLLPKSLKARTHCRAVSGEMHSGFANLRSALPMNLKADYPNFKVWAGAQADINRVVSIWRECLKTYDGPYLFGEKPTLADAMYAPVCTRFHTYHVTLDRMCADYVDMIMTLPDMVEWIEAARAEPNAVEELEAEF
ncbi:MAG: glutathione S-transferase family protein [Alphaproteobacteria bacterium]|nr:glutathione S-transferase family protein [Alphaproteobacteria bacterium]MBL7098529.1 glutathione S-transferase family protein [Alphaproteobacteria bacterium]